MSLWSVKPPHRLALLTAGLIWAGSASSSLACIAETDLAPRDVAAADVVAVGDITAYKPMSSRSFEKTKQRWLEESDLGWLKRRELMQSHDYALVSFTVKKQLSGRLPRRLVFILDENGYPIPPRMSGENLVVLDNPDKFNRDADYPGKGLYSVAGFSCNSSILFASNSPEANQVRGFLGIAPVPEGPPLTRWSRRLSAWLDILWLLRPEIAVGLGMAVIVSCLLVLRRRQRCN